VRVGAANSQLRFKRGDKGPMNRAACPSAVALFRSCELFVVVRIAVNIENPLREEQFNHLIISPVAPESHSSTETPIIVSFYSD
jgi:hypothetical protein